MVLAVLVGLVVLVMWRVGHRRRRRAEAAALQMAWRPLNEFDARFPADRRGTGTGHFGRRDRFGL